MKARRRVDRFATVLFALAIGTIIAALIVLAVLGDNPGWSGVPAGFTVGIAAAWLVQHLGYRRFRRLHPGYTAAVQRLADMAREDEQEFNAAVDEIMADEDDRA